MSLGMILLVILVLMLLGVFPTWPHSRDYDTAHNLHQWPQRTSQNGQLIQLAVVNVRE